MSKSVARSQVNQHLETQYPADVKESSVVGSEEVKSIDVLAGDKDVEASLTGVTDLDSRAIIHGDYRVYLR